MIATKPTDQPQTKAQLIARWRSAASEIRSEIECFPELDADSKSAAETSACLLEKCARQMELLVTT